MEKVLYRKVTREIKDEEGDRVNESIVCTEETNGFAIFLCYGEAIEKLLHWYPAYQRFDAIRHAVQLGK